MTTPLTLQPASGQVIAVRAPRQTWCNVLRNLGMIFSASLTSVVKPQQSRGSDSFGFSTNLDAARLTPSLSFAHDEVSTPDLDAMQLDPNVMDLELQGTFRNLLYKKRKRMPDEMESWEESSELEREREEIKREKERLHHKRIRLELQEDRLQDAQDRIYREEKERAQRNRDCLYEEETRIQSMRMAGVSLFQGASNVSIGGNSSFNIYYGSMGSGAWLTFVDAAGRTYPVPEYLTWSYHTFLEAINFMLHQDNEVAETQRSLINKGMYDLCIDQGTNIIPINGQESWSKVERDTKIVMRIPIWQTPEEIDSKKTYRCPLPNCNLWNEDPSMGASSTIGCQGCNSRFQVSALLEGKQQEISIPPCSPNEISDTPFLRNFHVQSVSTVTEHTRLGSMLFRRFYKSNSHTNLTYTVEHDKKAIQLTPEGHPKMHVYLAKLGKSLGRRFKHTGNLADIASAIEYCQQAIQLTPEGHSYIPLHLNDLGYSFRLRFEQTGDLADVARTIEYYQKAIQLIPEDDYKIPLYLHDMVQALQLRFKRTGNLADLVSAIEHNQKVIELIWEDHPDMPVRLNNMGSLLEQSFEKTGNSSDRAYAIECYQRALRLTRNTHWRFNKILDRLLHLQDIDDEITTEDAT